jgi:hypothetical protein
MVARKPGPGVSHRITRSADMVARGADVCLAGAHVILARGDGSERVRRIGVLISAYSAEIILAFAENRG